MTSFEVIIDADACPKSCLRIIRKLALIYQYQVITVASFNHRIENERHLVLGNEPQATDMAVINRTKTGDIVVTQDWGLAALVLSRGAWAIAPDGRIFSEDRIDLLLEERNILAKYRRGGGRTKGPSKRTAESDQRFEESFLKILDSIRE